MWLQVLLINSLELISLPAHSPEHAGSEGGVATARFLSSLTSCVPPTQPPRPHVARLGATLCKSTFVEVYNHETDNNDNSSKVNNGHSINVSSSYHIIRKRNYNAFCPLDTSSEKDTSITVFLEVCGFPKYREGEVPYTCFTTTWYKIRNCCR